MKKTFITVFVLVCFLWLLIYKVEAKSGCCSGHGGVSCAAGAQSNGKVVCNDGWRGSSCLYSEMVMCGGASDVVPLTSKPYYSSYQKTAPDKSFDCKTKANIKTNNKNISKGDTKNNTEDL